MNRVVVALALAVVLLVGVVIGQALAPRAEAQPAQRFTECFAATVWQHDGAAMTNPGFRPRSVRVPAGWTPVGGAGGGERHVILCR